MSAIRGERVKVGQANGPDIELIVSGDEFYAHYETPEGHSVIYDPERGLFCYAKLVNGRFESTGIPADQPAPVGTPLHEKESAVVRREKASKRAAERGGSAPGQT
jgi:hypothetical protein